MIAAGVDLGGTKIETQIFDASWSVVHRQRVETPKTYDALVAALAAQIDWATAHAGTAIPIGIGAAGLLNPDTGLAVTANICASGRPLQHDIEAAAGRSILYMNDCRALALSEAIFGAGRGHSVVAGLILGTGVGGGLAIDGHLMPSGRSTSGEFGHTSAPAHLVAAHNLPILRCGCGRMGCIETLISGPGLERVAKTITGQTMTTHDVAVQRHADLKVAEVWEVWVSLVADLILTLSRTADPDCVVIGGGLSQMDGMAEAISAALSNEQFDDFAVPQIVIAQGGDTSGARGAAYAATQGVAHD